MSNEKTESTKIEDALGKRLVAVEKSEGGTMWLLSFEDGSQCQIQLDDAYEWYDKKLTDQGLIDPAEYPTKNGGTS
jgi:hypothetical protein